MCPRNGARYCEPLQGVILFLESIEVRCKETDFLMGVRLRRIPDHSPLRVHPVGQDGQGDGSAPFELPEDSRALLSINSKCKT